VKPHLLELRSVTTHYGPIRVLRGVDLHVDPGEIVCLLGANAAGKTTTMKTILGIVRPTQGEVWFAGRRIDSLPTGARVELGLGIVPENRRIFPKLTVRENLSMGAYVRTNQAEIREDLERVLSLFPRLGERMDQVGGTLSGGEQQMLAIGRALMGRPQLVLMDEPSMGLAPILVERIFEIIQTINRQGTSVLVVEQNVNVALSIAHRGYVLQIGEIVLADNARALLSNEGMKRAYLGA
jgi:branched-chain amino acid transport system ATP-binding protein